ncbi:MAG TPA: VWA domain-containing protein [Vicinamibacterales bacterium]|jgi:VWFA-related protein|nr:VWA domain-containing protein [Vicinamibacterales bacterium]
MRLRDWSFLLLASAAGGVALAHARQQPSFKTGVQLVRIDVSVVDEKRQPVRGLQASDFTVLEDGQARPIRSFQAVDVAASTPPIAPMPAHEVATNRMGDDTSRLIFIFMDRSIPPERPGIVARQIADAAVDAMAPGDLAAIVTTGGGVPQNLTSDRARLHKTIAASDWSQGLSQAQTDDPIIGQTLGMGDALGDPRCMCGLCVMDTITRIANDVRDVPRRKVLLFIGTNIIVQAAPRDPKLDVGCEHRLSDSREKLFDALGTSDLTVHSIDPNGVASVGPATRATVPNGVPNRDGAVLRQQLIDERNDFMAAQGNLGVLPDLTGGRTILNSNEPFRLVPDVLRESDAYYLIAFDPIEGTGDVRHNIDVKVARAGVAVHTARFIPPSTPTATTTGAPAAASPLERALTDVLQNQSVPLGMSVATFAGPDAGHAYVGVTLDASAFAAKPGPMPLEIAVLASDERGRPAAGARQTGTVQVPLAPGSAGATAGFVELQTYLTLPPGEYELRAAVMDRDARAASSVFTHVTVPSFEDARLDLSDVVLGTRENAGSLPEGAPALPIVPTTTRVFNAGTPAWAFLRVYRAAETDAGQRVSIDATLLDSEGRRVRHQSLQSAAFTGRNADVRIGLPLKDLAPGGYVLRIDAKQGRAEVSRTIAYTVASTAAATPAEEHSPELTAALEAAATYLEQYEHRISAISAEEEYEQAVTLVSGSIVSPPIQSRSGPIQSRLNAVNGPSRPLARKTRANILTISLGARGWVAFRDVFQVDGRPVRDREERLARVLQNVTPDSLEQARQIAVESARYNIDPDTAHIERTINVPMTALLFLRAANQSRSSFHLGKPERVGGVECVTLQFSERGQPRLIRTSDDAPAQGAFWIDMANGGRIIKTEVRMLSGRPPVRSQTTVTYASVDRLDMWVPVVMDETYEVAATRQAVTGHATYSDFREFKVTTSADIK